MTDREKQREEAMELVRVLLAVIEEAGEQGAPATALYLPLVERGIKLYVFEGIMATMVAAGLLKKSNNVYTIANPVKAKDMKPIN